MKSAGGTELQVNYLNKYLDLSKYENINLIINQAAFKRIEAKKKNILWCHHYIDQPSIKLLKIFLSIKTFPPYLITIFSFSYFLIYF